MSSRATTRRGDRDAADRRLQRRQPARRRSACCAPSASRSPTRPRACAGADAGAGPDAADRRAPLRSTGPRSSSTTPTRPTRSRRRSPRCAPLAKERGGKLWCVFGCGGNRDAAKRPLMGAIACKLAEPRRRHQRQPAPRVARPHPGADPGRRDRPRRGRRDREPRRGDPPRGRLGRRRPTSSSSPARATRTTRTSAARSSRSPTRAQAAKALAGRVAAATATTTATTSTATTMMTLGDAARMLPGARVVGEPCDGDRARAQRHPQPARRATCSSPCAASASTPTTSSPQAKAAGAVAALAERGLDEAGLPGLEVADSRRALGELAAAWRRRFALPLVAVDRQQRQDHGDADDRVDPARLARRRGVRHRRQLQQRHRPAADAAAPARQRTAPRWSSSA